jgi:acetolactate synthase-1/2/3 large subunit
MATLDNVVTAQHGGHLAAEAVAVHGVKFLFTLCGGHISPLLLGAKAAGIRVVDVRHEATAVYAADAVARLTGVPGVACVTAGPGLTNTITAVKNAQLAQSPVVVIGGASATLLQGRGSLQDIDQVALMRPHVKWLKALKRVRDIVPAIERAFAEARSGVPGPVFLEAPLDLLYPEELVRKFHATGSASSSGPRSRLTRWYMERHLAGVFAGANDREAPRPRSVPTAEADAGAIDRAASMIGKSSKPLLLMGSGSMQSPELAQELRGAIGGLGVPTYLSGMARGLLGRSHDFHVRHARRKALRESDLVVASGTPFDFRLDYGRGIPRGTPVVAINRSKRDLTRNRRPDLAIRADPARALIALSERTRPRDEWRRWQNALRARDEARETEIAEQAGAATDGVNPLALCRAIDSAASEEAVFVGDGGDFVATASYIVRPRAPLSWLDPGVFGTLGPGAGFALGAKLCRPEAEVWLLYGDGAAGFSLAEFDTFARHAVPVIGVVGNDAGWTQIARDQVDLFGDDLATMLARTDYDEVAKGFGACGVRLAEGRDIDVALAKAKSIAAAGRPVLVNARIGRTDFRKGSLSV